MLSVIPSLSSPNRRYRLIRNEQSYRTSFALSYATWFSTEGDGETQHTPDMAVSQLGMLCDFLASCREALAKALVEDNATLIDGINSACSVFFYECLSGEHAAKAEAMARKGKQVYRHQGLPVTGDKYANLRDAEPLPRAPSEPSEETWALWRHNVLCPRLPTILDLFVSAGLADGADGYYVVRKLGQDNGVPSGELMQAARDYRTIKNIMEAKRALDNFTFAYRQTATPV